MKQVRKVISIALATVLFAGLLGIGQLTAKITNHSASTIEVAKKRDPDISGGGMEFSIV